MAGSLMTAAARARGVALLPVDSEHSAVFQCLEGHNRSEIRRILLTASGGPFRDREGGGPRPRHAWRRRSTIPPGGWAPRSRSTRPP